MLFYFPVPLIVAFLSFFLIGSRAHSHIYLPDDRQIVDLTDPRFAPLVRVNGGSGSMVGEDLVLTAFHCLRFTEDGQLKIKIRSDHPKYKTEAKVIYAWSDLPLKPYEGDTPGGSRDDWVLLKIDKPLGKKLGYYETVDYERLSRPKTIIEQLKSDFFFEESIGPEEEMFVLGYPFDFFGKPVVSYNQTILGQSWKMVYTNADAVQGNSGGPQIVCSGGDLASCRLLGVTTSMSGIDVDDHESGTKWLVHRPDQLKYSTNAISIDYIVKRIGHELIPDSKLPLFSDEN